MHPAFAAEVPYAVLVVELDEGVRMVGRLRDLLPADLELSLSVEIVFDPISDEVALPGFRPTSQVRGCR